MLIGLFQPAHLMIELIFVGGAFLLIRGLIRACKRNG
jgi:hypothetical protein